ncbi:hypothetical protein L1D61_27120 [Vibrio mediterranei]|nr:hypothetical protein [Vibrio mediterranei]MCG9790790.1 hypothetical protein [Vibrio mediterranei]
MRHIAVLLTLFHLNAFANILVTTAETGFQVINPVASNGVGTPLSRSINEDPSYPYWDSYCHSYAPLPSICYPLESEYRVTHRLIQGGTLNSVDVSFTSGGIYGSATVLENNSRLDLHSGWTHDVSRNYRINLPGLSRQPNYTTSGNCSNAISFVSPIGVERGLTMTVPLKSRNSTCTINFTDIDSDTDIHIAPGGTGWRYDNSIYNRLPSGNYTLSRIINDSIEVKEYRKGVAPNATKVLSGIDYRLKLKLLGSISFVINGDKDRRITLNPAQPESNQLRFDFRITSNFNQLNISF